MRLGKTEDPWFPLDRQLFYTARASIGRADADLVEMIQHVPGVLVDAIGSSFLQLVLPVATRQEPDRKGAGALSGQEVPNAVADDDGVLNRHAEAVGGG